MAECSGLVAFDQQMACPGESIGDNGPQKRIPGMTKRKRNDQGAQSENRAGGVHEPVARIGVLTQIEGKELFVVGKLVIGHLFLFLPGTPIVLHGPDCRDLPDRRQKFRVAPRIALRYY